jgi:hypothetical protein
MGDYVESLHQVIKKNISPWITYPQVEEAVFNYM